VVKVQVSAALEAGDPVGDREVVEGYVEPRFLHQTRAGGGGGVDDLDIALAEGLPGPWRVHYHVPVHAAASPPLSTTLPVLRAALGELFGGAVAGCDHLEVETYTWGVLPPQQRPRTPEELAAGIAAELAFTRDELIGLGLAPDRSSTVASR
jgi:hypothetical protein